MTDHKCMAGTCLTGLVLLLWPPLPGLRVPPFCLGDKILARLLPDIYSKCLVEPHMPCWLLTNHANPWFHLWHCFGPDYHTSWGQSLLAAGLVWMPKETHKRGKIRSCSYLLWKTSKKSTSDKPTVCADHHTVGWTSTPVHCWQVPMLCKRREEPLEKRKDGRLGTLFLLVEADMESCPLGFSELAVRHSEMNILCSLQKECWQGRGGKVWNHNTWMVKCFPFWGLTQLWPPLSSQQGPSLATGKWAVFLPWERGRDIWSRVW